MAKLLGFIFCVTAQFSFFVCVCLLALSTHLDANPVSIYGKARISEAKLCLLNRGNFSEEIFEEEVPVIF